MITRALSFIVLAVSCSLAFAADPPAPSAAPSAVQSEASIKQLLEAANVHKLIDTMMAQMETFMKSAMQQATQGRSVSARVQKDIDKRQGEMMNTLKEVLDWNKLEPMYVRVYQKTFTQQEVDGMIAFYKTPTGQALLNKMPLVLQNTMTEMQQMMKPIMERIQRMQQEVVAEIKAEKESGS